MKIKYLSLNTRILPVYYYPEWNPEFKYMYSGHWSLSPRYWSLNTRYWCLNTGSASPEYKILIPEYEILIPEYQILNPEYMISIPEYKTLIPNHSTFHEIKGNFTLFRSQSMIVTRHFRSELALLKKCINIYRKNTKIGSRIISIISDYLSTFQNVNYRIFLIVLFFTLFWFMLWRHDPKNLFFPTLKI